MDAKKLEVAISEVQLVDREHEAALEGIKHALLAFLELQGKQDGLQLKPKTADEYQARSLNQIEVTLQGAITMNQQKFLPFSGIAAAKFIEAESSKKEQELQNAIHDIEHTLQDTDEKTKRLQPDVKHMQMCKLVMNCLAFIAVTEGVMSYPAFRHCGFSYPSSVMASVGVGSVIGFTAHYLGGYIKNAITRLQRIYRYALSLFPAIVGFSMLGYLRAGAINTTHNLHLDTNTVVSHTAIHASAAAIAVISILLYWVALFLSSIFFRSKAERLQEAEFEKLSAEILALQSDIKNKEDEIAHIRYEKVAQMALALKRYEYAHYLELQIINFAQEAAEAYRQKNLRHRTDGCPSFFCYKPIFHFTTFFQTTKTQPQYETVH